MGTTPTVSPDAQATGHSANEYRPTLAKSPLDVRSLPVLSRGRFADAVPPLEHHPINTLLRYHLGWSDQQGIPSPTPASQGKALRPTLCMFACEAFDGQLDHAAPAAAALELIHNFSLIHDDIQDRGYERRHQPTVWAIWDTPRALVAGDSMQSLGDFTSIRAADSIPPATAITCLPLSPIAIWR